MSSILCTISTFSHLKQSFALAESVAKHGFELRILLVDRDSLPEMEWPGKAKIILLNEIRLPEVQLVLRKFKNNQDKIRWALKPVYLKYLLSQGFDEVIYCDNDIFFYNSPQFLFDLLQTRSFLLTPHFYKADPMKEQNWLEANFRVGLYNAGFIGVSQKGIPILEWWVNCCLYNVKKAFWRGLFDDQKYLDLVPVLFDDVEVIKHRGCNVAGWNDENHELKRDGDEVLVNGDPLIFIHFAALSMERFSRKDSFFFPEHAIYLDTLRKYAPGFQFRKSQFSLHSLQVYFYYLRWLFVRFLEKK